MGGKLDIERSEINFRRRGGFWHGLDFLALILRRNIIPIVFIFF